MKEGWSSQRPFMIKHISKSHYYRKVRYPFIFPYESLCGMFLLTTKRLKMKPNNDLEKCKRCLKSLRKEKQS